MSKELEFDGYWEGEVVYYCDNCHKREGGFRFDSSDIDYQAINEELKSDGWQITKVNNSWCHFCCEKCRNAYIRKNTL